MKLDFRPQRLPADSIPLEELGIGSSSSPRRPIPEGKMGKVELSSGTLQSFLDFNGVSRSAGLSPEALREILEQGLRGASQLGGVKAGLLSQQLDEIAGPIVHEILLHTWVGHGARPFVPEREPQQLPWSPLPSDSPLVQTLGAPFANQMLEGRVLAKLNAALAGVNLEAEVEGGRLSIHPPKVPPKDAAPGPRGVARVLRRGDFRGFQERAAMRDAATFAAAEIVNQLVTKLSLMDHGQLKSGKALQELPIVISTQDLPKLLAERYAWAQSQPTGELWRQVGPLVEEALNKSAIGQSYAFEVVEVSAGKIVLEREDRRAPLAPPRRM
ncbi:MAG: hypothetical protein U1E65_05960 [Myxococcota bacterium]